MQYEESIDRAWQRSGRFYSDDAKTASSVTLTVLGECLNGREKLAESLRRQPPDRGMIFSSNDLVHLGWEEALTYASAAIGILEEAVSGGEMEDVRRQFRAALVPSSGQGTGRRVRGPASECA